MKYLIRLKGESHPRWIDAKNEKNARFQLRHWLGLKKLPPIDSIERIKN